MDNRHAMVVGGSNGIGLALVHRLIAEGYDKIYIADKSEPDIENDKTEYIHVDLTDCDYKLFQDYTDIDTLIITAGFGRAAYDVATKIKEFIDGKEVSWS